MKCRQTIKIRLTNNTGVRVPIEILNPPDGADLNTLVFWDLASETFTSSALTLTTTPQFERTLEDLTVQGVVDQLNTMNVATFFRVGFIIYAVALLNSSCSTADIVIGDTVYNVGSGYNSTAFAYAIDGSGRALVSGFFTTYKGTTVNYITRLNTDGSLDTTFVTGTGFDQPTFPILVQSDGNIIIGGDFTDYNGTSINRIIRVTSAGVYDNTFAVGTGFDGEPVAGVLQSDGKVLITGNYLNFNGTGTSRITRLTTLGAIYRTFVYGTGLSATGYDIKEDGSGNILIVGAFTTYNGTGANRIVRLTTLGAIDGTFVYGTGFDNQARAIEIDGSGDLYVAGFFTTYNGTGANRIVKLTSLGAIDGGFVYGTGFNGNVFDIAIQTDGKIVCVGAFTDYNGTSVARIARLNTDGSLDTTFNTAIGTGLDNNGRAVQIQSDGKIIITGDFTDFNGTAFTRIVRLNADGTSDSSI